MGRMVTLEMLDPLEPLETEVTPAQLDPTEIREHLVTRDLLDLLAPQETREIVALQA